MRIDRSIVEEKQWLEGLLHGNVDAFTALYYHYGGKLHAHLLRMVKSEEIAREILQDTFMKIWEHRERTDVDKPFGAYLNRIAENRVYDHFRSLAREKRLAVTLFSAFVDSHTDHEDEVMQNESTLLIHKAIDLLPPVRRKVYLLSRIEGKSYEEISDLLDISTSTINDHIVKANRFLKKVLTRHIDAVVLWIILFSVEKFV
jgi:RNA polymerase sigma-70 factor (family 1)